MDVTGVHVHCRAVLGYPWLFCSAAQASDAKLKPFVTLEVNIHTECW